MLHRPKLRSHLEAAVLKDRVLLIGEGRYFALTGRAFGPVLGLLDGERTTDRIVDGLLGELPAVEIYQALIFLEKQGHVEEAGSATPAPVSAFWGSLDVATPVVAERLAGGPVFVQAVGDVPLDDLVARLGAVGVRRASEAEAPFHVVLTDDYLRDELEAWNRRALLVGRPWLLVRPNGLYAWIGPLFEPGRSGCWACLAHRLRGHRDVEEFARQEAERREPF